MAHLHLPKRMEANHTHTDTRWTECLRMIHNNLQEQQFNTWFAPIHSVTFNEERRELTLCVPSPFIYEYIEKHFVKLLSAVLKHVYGAGVSLIYKVMTDATNDISMDLEGSTAGALKVQPRVDVNKSPRLLQELDSQLRPEYTFDNFVEGAANKLPRTVGLAIAQNPKQSTFNPLFIYGGSGTGKTHLVNAIGLRLKELHPELRVLYVSAHLFQVQYTDSVRNNTTNDFINFYQNIDVLIIDDVQEFVTKATQQTFFHIFNHLHQNGRQLILTSDRPPVALQGMEERLLTRFKWGLLAELERPDVELRRNILLHKIHRDGLHIQSDVVNYIANNVDKSIRDLEGVLTSLMAYSIFNNSEIALQLAEQVISRTIGLAAKQQPVTIDRILEFTSNHFEQDTSDILSSSRKAPVVLARQVAMFLAQKLTHLSTTRIGMAIGHRGHATVVHSCQVISERLTIDSKLREQIEAIEQQLTTNG